MSIDQGMQTMKAQNVNDPDKKLKASLLGAAWNGNTKTVARLLDSGADPNTTKEDGASVLMGAASRGHHETAALLLDRGADVNAWDQWGNTALTRTISNGHSFRERAAHASALTRTISNGLTDMVALLLDHGADVNAPRSLGDRTALTHAAKDGHKDIVALLLDHGADVNLADGDGTALIYATKNGCAETLALLLERGANVNTQNKWGNTALIEAAACRNTTAVALLLDHGADLDATNRYGATSLAVAEYRCAEAAALIRAHQEARSLDATLDSARPPETVPEPSERAHLSTDSIHRAAREDLGAPDQRPVKPGRPRL